ncbi:MAG: hypothetical protein RI580_03605 [Halothece sp. Uz-M2-17]|nr:hypothetical protein [Halothece sp. Uz-M2-17]
MTKLNILTACALGAVMVSVAQGAQAITLSIDDGTAENAIGLTEGGDALWLNSFTAQPNSQVVTGISLTWGTPAFAGANGIANGDPTTVYLYGDSDNDGNPDDATLVQSIDTTMQNVDTNTFTTIDFAPATFNVGDVFFVGASFSQNSDFFVASVDETDPYLPDRSFITGGGFGTLDTANLSNNSLFETVESSSSGPPGNFLVRAEAEPVPFEAETTLGLAILGGYVAFRKFRQRQANMNRSE